MDTLTKHGRQRTIQDIQGRKFSNPALDTLRRVGKNLEEQTEVRTMSVRLVLSNEALRTVRK